MTTRAFQKVYTKIDNITKATITLRATGVGNDELATVGGRLAQVVKIMGEKVTLQVFAGTEGLATDSEVVFHGEPPVLRKKEEALSLLKKWFPQMENFSGQLKKYKVTINDLLAENEQLEARAKASEKGKMKDTMERAKLESELKDIQRLVDRIPPEVLAELKRQQRYTKER